ncbi:hypothetical protein LSAT2_004856 [Lamellibrachia satsuma]|nr:hypothetical protein LSAT2_004856 [Lamellibrachia satsuma]
MATWDVWTLLLVLAQMARQGQGGAILEVHMLTYKNPSGRDWDNDKCDSSIFGSKWKCDLKLIFCFDRYTGNSDPESCSYKKAKTGEFSNHHEIAFDHDMASVQNPIRLDIDRWTGAIRFKVKIVDDDSFNRDDLVDRMNTVWYITAARSVNQASWSRKHVTGTRRRQKTSLALNLRLYCQQNYYNSQCTKYCEASDTIRHYTCDPVTGDKVCRPGWEGNHCEIISDDCIDNKCTNGATCRDGHRQYMCRCRKGFTGRYCETNIDDCAAAPCLNGGRCVDEVAGYSCVCQPEYVGDRCSHHVCDSDQSPCLNGGTCYARHGKARCMCSVAFSGDVCERDTCLDMTCLNQGTCVKGRCVCKPGFLGYFCSVDLCRLRPCMNGASCEAGLCRCAPGYSGFYCHEQTNECESDPCQHDGTCRDRVNGYACDCLPDYNGTLCEHVIPTPPPPDWDHVVTTPFVNNSLEKSPPSGRDVTTSAPSGRDVTTSAPSGRDVTTPARLADAREKEKHRGPDSMAVYHKTSTIPVWMIAVIAGLAVLVLLVLLLLLFLMRRWKRKASRAADNAIVFQNRGNGAAVTGIRNPQFDDLQNMANESCSGCSGVTPPPYTTRAEDTASKTPLDTGDDDKSQSGTHFENPVYDSPLPPREVAAASTSKA